MTALWRDDSGVSAFAFRETMQAEVGGNHLLTTGNTLLAMLRRSGNAAFLQLPSADVSNCAIPRCPFELRCRIVPRVET